jgi:hypothetical protein
MEARRVLKILLIMAVFCVLMPVEAWAYDDSLGGPHSAINMYAFENFQKNIMPNDQYLKNAELDTTKVSGISWGVEDGAKGMPPKVEVKRQMTMEEWIVQGGYSADEPEWPMALVHFYDPKNPSKAWLTDQQAVVEILGHFNSQIRNPEIDAVEWAMGDKDTSEFGDYFKQDYSWKNGKDYFKLALASTDPNNENYGKAWRSVGETMHLMADMTVPAHVRNDGHASALRDKDPYEQTTYGSDVINNAAGTPASINYDQDVRSLMKSVATFTNENFLSKDTISLPPGKTSAYTHTYALPDITKMQKTNSSYLLNSVDGKTVYAAAPRTWFSKWFETGQQEYMIDSKVVNDQRSILIPTAIRANEQVINRFLPRFEVKADIQQEKPGSSEYVMVGSINQIYNAEWPETNRLTIKNGAYVVVKGAGGKETRTPVKLIDKNSDLNELTMTFNANKGDTVWLEYDLGGYVVKSPEQTISDKTILHKKVLWPGSNWVRSEYDYYLLTHSDGSTEEVWHGNFTMYEDAGGHVIERNHYKDHKLDGEQREYYVNSHGGGIKLVETYANGVKLKQWYYSEGGTLNSIAEYDASGKMIHLTNYKPDGTVDDTMHNY